MADVFNSRGMISSAASGVAVAVADDNKEDRGGFISEINIVLLFSGTALPLLCATLPILFVFVLEACVVCWAVQFEILEISTVYWDSRWSVVAWSLLTCLWNGVACAYLIRDILSSTSCIVRV